MEFGFRPAEHRDAEFFADVLTAVRPSAPMDPKVMRFEREHPPENLVIQEFVVETERQRIGFANVTHPKWEVSDWRFGSVGGDLLPAYRDARSISRLLGDMEARLGVDGGRTASARANEGDSVRIEAIVGRGFREDRRSKRWELDLVANRERILEMTEQSRARMRDQGVRLLTVADDPDPEVVRKIWQLSVEADADVPSTLPHIEETLEDYIKWLEYPDIRRDRFWLAAEGDEIVGLSVLGYPPVRGVVGTAWTATARHARGRGIARAVKCETLAQAIALGVDRVRTGNDAANDPILHINASMGYQPIPGSIGFLKEI